MVFLFGFLLFIVALFLILLVLVQRGKGGGLAGALGGMGGQSALARRRGTCLRKSRLSWRPCGSCCAS